MKKASLTVFFSLTLSIFLSFCLILIEITIQNQQRIRFQSAVDVGMDSVLGEYSVALYERYGLFYVDTSYLYAAPSIENMENQLQFYLKKNMQTHFENDAAPWGNLLLTESTITSFETAAAENGASLRNQAAWFVQNSGESHFLEDEVREAVQAFRGEHCEDMIAEWEALMGQIQAMELPKIENEKGEWEEVPLDNPADWVYELSKSDFLFLCEAELESIEANSVNLDALLSHRGMQNSQSYQREFEDEPELFLRYLATKMGSYQNGRQHSVLSCQMEYLLAGDNSDLRNLEETVCQMFLWRMYDNQHMAFQDNTLYGEAVACAEELMAVQLKPEFREPVIKSILYACVFLESMSDLKVLLHGGKVPLRKTVHAMSVNNVKNSTVYTGDGQEGLSYRQYAEGMLYLEDLQRITIRAMDLMEMDIRRNTQNDFFSMDFCVERFCAKISARGAFGKSYRTSRKYGYF